MIGGVDSAGIVLATAWRIAFLSGAAPVIGAVLLLAIARLTGAGWDALAAAAKLSPMLVPAGALLGLSQLPTAPPHHLLLWGAWWAVGLRAMLAAAALSFASTRLRGAAGATLAGAALAIYALTVTALASDWMLGQVPGHPVSAIGLMQFTESVAGMTATALLSGLGPAQFRRDMAKLMVAAVLGLAYLAYMDYLIIWYGNLPFRVAFYVERSSAPMALLVWGALAAGIVAPILLLSLGSAEWSRRTAGAAVLAALFLFNSWWVAGGLFATLGGLVLTGAIAAAAWRLWPREDAYA